MTMLNVQQKDFHVGGILFDKDGTLIDFVSLWGYWANSMYDMLRHHLGSSSAILSSDEAAHILGTYHNIGGDVIGYDRKGPLAMGSMSDMMAILAWNCGYIFRDCRYYDDEIFSRVF